MLTDCPVLGNVKSPLAPLGRAKGVLGTVSAPGRKSSSDEVIDLAWAATLCSLEGFSRCLSVSDVSDAEGVVRLRGALPGPGLGATSSRSIKVACRRRPVSTGEPRCADAF